MLTAHVLNHVGSINARYQRAACAALRLRVVVPVPLVRFVKEVPGVGLLVSASFDDDDLVVLIVNVIGGLDLGCFGGCLA